MLASPADWTSPGSRDGYRDDPPAWDGGKVKISLGATRNQSVVEWIHPSTGKTVAGDAVTGGGDREFTAPFDGDAVLHRSPRPAKTNQSDSGSTFRLEIVSR